MTRPVLHDGSDALVVSDFDGTLSPIVDDPAAAGPADGAIEALVGLGDVAGEVAVISGRPLAFLRSQFPESVSMIGLYGLQTLRGGELGEHEQSGVWRETMADVASRARKHGPAEMNVELKELSITLHYRGHPELATPVRGWADGAARDAGLRVRDAKMSVELHPPIDEDKGTALARLAAEHTGPVVFCGDDLGDLPAFDALDELERAGREVLRVAADSDELPDEMRARADEVVDGPAGVVELLRSLRG